LTSKYKRIPGFKKRGNPVYRAWSSMMNRCYSKNSKDYLSYGNSGILVCKKWHNFEYFYNDMKPSFIEGLTLDRINNKKGYSFKNCRWATRKMQAINRKSSNQIFDPNSKIMMTITDLAIKYRLSRNTITSRIRLGHKKFAVLIASPNSFYIKTNGRRSQECH
jgi:hypothetical protein